MGEKTAVVDTNVFVSALFTASTAKSALRKLLRTKTRILITPQQLDEIRRVFAYDKIDLAEQQQKQEIRDIKQFTTLVQIQDAPALLPDPLDDIILKTALHHGADLLITGDKQLLAHKTDALTICTPGDYLRTPKPF